VHEFVFNITVFKRIMSHFHQLNDKDCILDIFLLLLLFTIAILLRVHWIVTTGFNGLYGQDAYAYFDFALELRHALIEWRLPEPFFWPLGYPALLMMMFSVFGASAGVGQVLNVLLGCLLPVLAYLLARQAGSRWFGGLVAGLLMAFCGQAIQSSIVVMADIPALFWATLSAVLLNLYLRQPPPLNQPTELNANGRPHRVSSTFEYVLIISALCLTFAGITRWLYFGLAPLWTWLVLIHWRGKIRWWDSIAVLAVVLLLLIPQLAYSRTTPFPTLNHAWVVGWSPLNAVRQLFINDDGQFAYAYSNWRFYAAPLLDAYYMSPVFVPFMLIGLWVLWRQGVKGYVPIMMLLGWVLLPYLFLIGIPYQNIRFPLIVVPVVVVLVGMGMDALWHFGYMNTKKPFLPSTNKLPMRLLRFTVLVAISTGIGHTFKASEANIGAFIHNQQQDKAIATWVNEQLPADATLYTFGLTLTLQHETPFTVYELYYETPESLAAKRSQTDYLLLNLWVIENQWQGREPYIAYHWLNDNRGLIRLERYGNYTLFRMDG
jgi:hypothetical protein